MITDLLFYSPNSSVGIFYSTYQGDVNLLRQNNGWRPSWTHIISGNFGGNGFTDLLFYEASTGTGEFYTTDGHGGITLLQQHTNWRQTWTHIIPGNFGGSGFTDLLFYEASTGTGEFYTTNGQGGLTLLRQHTNWRETWTQIIPGNFGGNGYTDLLFYEASTGTGEFYATNGQGGITQLQLHTNWRETWTQIIPGNFGGNGFTDLLFYEASTGTGEFYATNGQGGITQLQQHTNWRETWTQIIPGDFGGNSFTDLFFYEGSTGTGEFYSCNGAGDINLLKQHNQYWQLPYTLVIPGLFAPLQAVILHIKVLKQPLTSIQVQLEEIREAFVSAGIRVIVKSIETLDLPHLLDIDINCEGGYGDNITGDVAELYRHRANVGKNELAIYYLNSTNPPLGGCAKYPGEKAGAVVTYFVYPYTLAHEIGHILSLDHVSNNKNLMHKGDIQDPPPNLSSYQIFRMYLSKYSINL